LLILVVKKLSCRWNNQHPFNSSRPLRSMGATLRTIGIMSVALLVGGCASLSETTSNRRVCDPYDLIQNMSQEQAEAKCGMPYAKDTIQSEGHVYEKLTWTSGRRIGSTGSPVTETTTVGLNAYGKPWSAVSYQIDQPEYYRQPIEVCEAWFKDETLLAWHFLVDNTETVRKGNFDEIKALGQKLHGSPKTAPSVANRTK